MGDMTTHYRLSPSAAHRWLQCPGSVLLSERVGLRETSAAATLGTYAHKMAEVAASHAYLGWDNTRAANRIAFHERSAPQDVPADFSAHIAQWVAALAKHGAGKPGVHVELEAQLATPIPECRGTADAVLYDSETKHLTVLDFKYGVGPVSPAGNPQLRIYAVGALARYRAAETVTVGIVQPRLSGPDETETLTASELLGWLDAVVRPAATKALDETAQPEFNPSDDACVWCPARGACAALARTVAVDPFSVPPGALSTAELAERWRAAKAMADWAEDARKQLRTRAALGEALPGIRVSTRAGARAWKNAPAVVQALTDMGQDVEALAPRAPRSPAQLKSRLTKEELACLEPLMTAPSTVQYFTVES